MQLEISNGEIKVILEKTINPNRRDRFILRLDEIPSTYNIAYKTPPRRSSSPWKGISFAFRFRPPQNSLDVEEITLQS